MTPEDVISIDDDELTEPGLDTADIFAAVSDCSDSEGEDPEAEPDCSSIPAITATQSNDHLQAYWQFLMTNMEDCPSHQELLSGTFNNIRFVDETILKSKTQSSITSFFKPV